MEPTREVCIHGRHLVREYYWAGEYPVYLDQQLQDGKTFEQVCREVRDTSRMMPPNTQVQPRREAASAATRC